MTRTLRWISTTTLQLQTLVYHSAGKRTEMIRCTIALFNGATLAAPTDMKLIFLFRFLVINGFIFYFPPQKSIQTWLHSETLAPCPVNPARNCCFIEAIFSLNNNQTFIASFMLWAEGVSSSVALLCPSCSFQLCSLVWRKYERKKDLFEPVFIIIYRLISWSNIPALCVSTA